MAYKREYIRRCYHVACAFRASFEVVNGINEVTGYYCSKHADQRVRELERNEDKMRAEGRWYN